LLTNAVSYALNGNVTVSTALDTHRNSATLVIENSGIGIDPTDLPHLFERFYRGSHVAESSIPGAGLGLAMLKRLSICTRADRSRANRRAKDALYHVSIPLAPSEIPA